MRRVTLCATTKPLNGLLTALTWCVSMLMQEPAGTPKSKRHKATTTASSSSSFEFTRFLCLMALLATTCTTSASSTTPSVHRASQLAIGEWDLFLKCSRDVYESVLFPHVKTHAPATLVPRFLWDRDYPCRLSMFSNGTFSLEPKLEPTLRPKQRNSLLTSIHGKWEALPNPYCATDRYYDELVFCSNSRVERQLPRSGLLPWTNQNETLLKKIRFRLNCRLYGQYWSSDGLLAFHAFGGKTATARGRLSHGVLVTDQLDGTDKPAEWWQRRVVSGSFTGFRRRPLIPTDEDPLYDSAP